MHGHVQHWMYLATQLSHQRPTHDSLNLCARILGESRFNAPKLEIHFYANLIHTVLWASEV